MNLESDSEVEVHPCRQVITRKLKYHSGASVTISKESRIPEDHGDKHRLTGFISRSDDENTG